MRQNPLHYLTYRQIALLAEAEGLSVEQLLAKYGGIRQRGAASSPAKKRPATSAKKREVSRGQVFRNPSPSRRPKAPTAAELRGLTAAELRWLDDAADLADRGLGGYEEELLGPYPESPKRRAVIQPAGRVKMSRNPRTAAQNNAGTAMRLYHSGQASSLQEAWDIVKSGRRR